MRFLPLLPLLLILTAVSPARAEAPINDEGAERVKTLVQNMIDMQKKMHDSATSQLVTQGNIKVEQAQNYYAVTLPDITAITQIDKDGETKKLITKIGIIGINVMPTQNDKEWKMSVAIPTPIKYFDENDQTLMRLDIGQQQMIGVWNEDLNAFANLNGLYSDVLLQNTINEEKGKIRMRIGKLSIKNDLTENENGLWSGPSEFSLSDFSVEAQKADQTELKKFIDINNMNIKGSMSGFSADAQRQIQAFVQKINTTEVQDPAVYKDMIPLIFNMADAMALKISMNGLKIFPAPHQAAQEPFELQEAFFGFSLEGLKDKMMNKKISFGWHGLSGTKEQQTEDNTIPTTMSLAFALDKLPLEPLFNLGDQLANSGANKDNIAQMAMMNAMMTLPQKLSEAGTTIKITDTMVQHPHYKFELDGHLKADQASMIGVNGEATVKALGIENAITLLKKQSAEATPEKQARIKQLIGNLEMLQQMLKDDPNGSDLKTAHFVLDNQGQTLVNGQNIKELMAAQTMSQETQQQSQ